MLTALLVNIHISDHKPVVQSERDVYGNIWGCYLLADAAQWARKMNPITVSLKGTVRTDPIMDFALSK